MGGSESRCYTDNPEHKLVGIKNMDKDFEPMESPFKATRFIHDDPRSPSQTVDRTPIQVMSTPVQPKPVMCVQPVIKSSLRNRHVGNVNNAVNSDAILLDSLTTDSGTPITTRFLASSDQDDGTFTIATLCDVRSPSQGILRTPLLVKESEVFCDKESVTDGNALIICDTPKKHQEDVERGDEISELSPDVSLVDPRSPTQGIERTPVAKSEKSDHNTVADGVRNLHDPRSPTIELSRTPIGALFSGCRELRRTVLMTNAFMASPLFKKVAQNITSQEEEENHAEMASFEHLEDNINDEIPAILHCNSDFNNHYSSRMVASIGSKVDCISLDNSLDEDQVLLNRVDTLEIKLMARQLREVDCTDFSQKGHEKTPTSQLQDSVSPCDDTPNNGSSEISVLQLAVTMDKRKQNGNIRDQNADVCRNIWRNLQGGQSLHNEHVDDASLNSTQSPATEPTNLRQQCSRIPANSSDGPKVEMCDKILPVDAIHSDKRTVKVDSSRNELVQECGKAEEFPHVTNQKGIKRSGSEELQIAERLGDFVSMTISTRESQNDECDANACLDVDNEPKPGISLPDNHGDVKNEDVIARLPEFEGDSIWEKGGIQQEETNSIAIPAAVTQNIRDGTNLGNGVTEINQAKSTVLNNLNELGSLGVYKLEESAPIKISDECDQLGAKMENEITRKEGKPQRKLRPPTTVTHRKKNTGSRGTVRPLKDSPIGHVSKCHNEQRASFARRPKSDSDDARALDQESSSKSVVKKPTRKSESKLVTPTAVRSPLAILTNDAKTKTDCTFQFTGSTAKTTKLPRYQGTPPIAVDTRSLNITFSGQQSSSSHSVERQKSRLKSFTYNKEN